MRERMRKGLAWCLAAVLLLGLLPLSPRATAAEERDLSQAEIEELYAILRQAEGKEERP